MTKETLNIDGQEVVLDEANMAFSDATLTEYLKKEAPFYNYFGFALAKAESVLAIRDADYEHLYSLKFAEYKGEGGSDKMAEARTLGDNEVLEAKYKCVHAKEDVRKIQQHLRAWDKSHENALNLGYMLRKEMEKFASQHIMMPTQNDPQSAINDPEYITSLINGKG